MTDSEHFKQWREDNEEYRQAVERNLMRGDRELAAERDR